MVSGQKPVKRGALDPQTWDAAVREIREICVLTAKLRTTLTYTDLTLRLTTVAADPGSYVFHHMLRAMCQAEETAGRGMLCALVVQKATGRPGAGFYKAIAKIRPDEAHDLEACWQAECARLYAYWEDHDD
jgi:hypothetical protein